LGLALNSLIFGWMELTFEVVMRILAVIRADLGMELVLQDVGTLHLTIYQLSVHFKKLSPLVKVTMIVFAAVLERLRLLQMFIYLTPVYFVA
jgi:hypothetical protein